MTHPGYRCDSITITVPATTGTEKKVFISSEAFDKLFDEYTSFDRVRGRQEVKIDSAVRPLVSRLANTRVRSGLTVQQRVDVERTPRIVSSGIFGRKVG